MKPAAASSAKPDELSKSDIDFFVGLVSKRIGVQLQGKEYLISGRLGALARDTGKASTSDVIAAIRRGDRSVEEAAISAMTTNETSFYRDAHPFEGLAEHVIGDVIAANGGRLTIWNGACSSGQESYTLAMTILENFPQLARPGRLRIISTDVSQEMVERTKAGRYSDFEVRRGLPSDMATKYFDRDGPEWVAKKSLRDLIETQQLNLMEPWARIPKCDIVFMRNVLIYFTIDLKKDILRRIRTDVLQPHGCLLLGASESCVGLDSHYAPKQVGSTTFFYRT